MQVRAICEKNELDGEQAILMLMVLDPEDVEAGITMGMYRMTIADDRSTMYCSNMTFEAC